VHGGERKARERTTKVYLERKCTEGGKFAKGIHHIARRIKIEE
jgi:hypothetical protein